MVVSQTHPNIAEALKKAEEMARSYLNDVGLDVEVKIEDDGYSDPLLNLEGVCLFPQVEQEDILSIRTGPHCDPGHMKSPERIRWYVQVIVHDPGVRYYPDGSGQPPSDDIADIDNYWDLSRALIKAIGLIVEDRLSNAAENYAMDRMAEQEDPFNENSKTTS